MNMIKYFAFSLLLVGSAHAAYTKEQTEKTIELLSKLPLDAQCAQASALILAAPNATLTQQEKDAMRAQIKMFAANLVQYHAFLEDVKKAQAERAKVKEITQQ